MDDAAGPPRKIVWWATIDFSFGSGGKAPPVLGVHFGDRVPAVSCHHHAGVTLNLTLTGRFYCDQGNWSLEPDTFTAMLNRMEQDLEVGPKTSI